VSKAAIFLLLFFVAQALPASAYPRGNAVDLQRKTAMALTLDKCVPAEITAMFSGAFNVVQISQWVYMFVGNSTALYFDSDEKTATLLTVHRITEDGHLLVWLRPNCESS